MSGPGDETQQPAAEVEAPQTDAKAQVQDGKTVIDQTFGLVVRQRTRCLAQHKAEKHREFRSFQVDVFCNRSPCGFANWMTDCNPSH